MVTRANRLWRSETMGGFYEVSLRRCRPTGRQQRGCVVIKVYGAASDLQHIVYRGASEKNVYFYNMYVRKKHNRSLEAVLCINVCIHVECAFDAAAGAANGLKAQRAWGRETGTLTLHGEQTDLSL